MRRSAIAALMLLLLLASLSLAFLTTIQRHIEVDGLDLELPRTWTKVEPPQWGLQHVGAVAAYRLNSIDAPLLIVASLRPDESRPSEAALAQAMSLLESNVGRPQTNQTFRADALTGRLYIGHKLILPEKLWPRPDMFAVLTEDSRRYWMVHMIAHGNDHDVTRDSRLRNTFMKILESIKPVSDTAATGTAHA